jgi:hypothetical protein
MKKLNNCVIIIRASGERTAALCKELVKEQGVVEAQVLIINKTPFSESLRQSFRAGISINKKWTLCVDADVLLRKNSLIHMLSLAEKQSNNLLEIQGYVLDKFFGGVRKGGIHLYRTSLLKIAINKIPNEGVDIRPETYMLNAMSKEGYPWLTVPYVVGLHDFEQNYKDIYRKCFVYSRKHFKLTYLFLEYWRQHVKDSDYKVAIMGFSSGLMYPGDIRIDAREKYFDFQYSEALISEKNTINVKDWSLERIENIISSWNSPEIYYHFFPFGATNDRLFSKIKGMIRIYISTFGYVRAVKLGISWIFRKIGKMRDAI